MKRNNAIITGGIIVLSVLLLFFWFNQSRNSLNFFGRAVTSTPTPTPDYTITLRDKQKEKLRTIVKTNAEAKKIFADVLRVADKATTSSPNPVEKLDSSAKTTQTLIDADKIYNLSLAYVVTQNSKYLENAKQYLLAWARSYFPTGNAQDDSNLISLIEGYDLIKNEIGGNQRIVIDSWLANLALQEAENKSHSAERLTMLGMIGFSINNDVFLHAAVNEYKDQLGQDFNPDGSSFAFQQDQSVEEYLQTIQPYMLLARYARLNGFKIYTFSSTDGANLSKSVDFLKDQLLVESDAKIQSKTAFYEEAYFFQPEVLPDLIKLTNPSAKEYPTVRSLIIAVERS